MTSVEQRNIEVVKEHFDALNNRDKERLRELLADDFRVLEDGLSKEEYIQANWDQFIAPFPDWTESVERSFAKGDMVAVRFRFTGTHEGVEFLGIPPSGAEVEGTGIYIVEVSDEEMQKIWYEWDSNAVLEALGILPESTAELRIQGQLLEVLLRVLRHNIRNDLNTIDGMADLIATGEVDPQEYAERIQRETTALQSTAQKVRDVERGIVHAHQSESVNLAELIGSVVVELRDQYSEAQFDVNLPDEDLEVTSNQAVLSVVLEEAIENAVIHANTANPEIEVNLKAADGEERNATIAVVDNGPGIPAHELRPLERGGEDPLDHGSGIGLWAIKWGIERLDGEVEFEANEPTGSIVRLYVGDMD